MAATAEGDGRLFALDAMSLAFRAFFALPEDLATEGGLVTNALHGFTSMLANVVRDHRPSALAAAFDLPGETFRHELVADYKAGRAETPDTLLAQFDMIRELLGALGVPVLSAEGFEADDVLATLATRARDEERAVVVVTGDRDCFQLVEDPFVQVLYNRRGVSDYSLYDEAGILERTGVLPVRYPMLAAMRGDPSDNLPGVPGVGEKTAARLLRSYGDLDGIFSHLGDLTPKLRERLEAHESLVRSNAEAMLLVRDVPLDCSPDELVLGGWQLDEVKAVFERYELRSLWRRVAPLLAEGRFGPPAPGSAVPATDGHAGPMPDPTAPAPAAPGSDGRRDVASLVEPVVAPDAIGACRALEALWREEGAAGTPGAFLVVVGRWEGSPGRSALEGLALVDPAPPGAGVWLRGELLADERVRAALAALLARAPIVGHGVKEILRSLLPLGVDVSHLEMDVEVAAYLLDPTTGDYGVAALRAADGPDGPDGPGADAGGAPGPAQLPIGDAATASDAEAPARGAVSDALAVAAAAGPLRARLAADGLERLHDEVERPLVRVLARMEVAGIRVDAEELRRLTGELSAQCGALVAEIHGLAGHEFNVNSTPQLRTVLYTELGLSPGRKTKTGYSTDAQTLETLRDAHPIVDRLLRYREVEKLRSTYGETLLAEVAPDGRIHASFRQTVARTGRISSEHPNLHNIPARRESGSQFRRAFVPAPGSRFLVADYDQVELRVIAHLSGDPGLVGAFTSGLDIHRAVASGVFGVPPGEVTREQRERAKMVSYGLAYGMEPFGLARRLATGVEEAQEIMDGYFRAFPRVRAYMVETVAEARGRGYTLTEMGRRRPIPDLHARNYQRRSAAERQAMNAGIQGLAADLFKVALVKLDGALERERMASRLVLQVHDEVLLEVVPAEEDAAAALTRDALTHAVDLSVPLELTMAWGDSWAVKA